MRPILAGVLAAVLGLGACSGSHETQRDHSSRDPAPRRPISKLDVPTLLNLSIDEVGKRVGPIEALPPGFADPTMNPMAGHNEPQDSLALFRYGGLALVVAYDYHTRRVRDLLLLGSNENDLMAQARLQLGAEHYLVLPVFQTKHPTQLLGLRVLTLGLPQ